MVKAIREAKVHTSWINPNEAYDAAIDAVRRGDPRPEAAREFLDDFARDADRGLPGRDVQLRWRRRC